MINHVVFSFIKKLLAHRQSSQSSGETMAFSAKEQDLETAPIYDLLVNF